MTPREAVVAYSESSAPHFTCYSHPSHVPAVLSTSQGTSLSQAAAGQSCAAPKVKGCLCSSRGRWLAKRCISAHALHGDQLRRQAYLGRFGAGGN